MKYVLSFLVVLIGFMWWKSQRKSNAIAKARERPASRDDPQPPQPPQDGSTPIEMASCAKCGLHLPHTEVIESHGRVFCSREHARGD